MDQQLFTWAEASSVSEFLKLHMGIEAPSKTQDICITISDGKLKMEQVPPYGPLYLRFSDHLVNSAALGSNKKLYRTIVDLGWKWPNSS